MHNIFWYVVSWLGTNLMIESGSLLYYGKIDIITLRLIVSQNCFLLYHAHSKTFHIVFLDVDFGTLWDESLWNKIS